MGDYILSPPKVKVLEGSTTLCIQDKPLRVRNYTLSILPADEYLGYLALDSKTQRGIFIAHGLHIY